MSIRPMPETVAAWALDAVRRAGAPHTAIVNAIVIGGADVGHPIHADRRIAGALPDAIDRGHAVRHDDGSWEPTALGVLASWASYLGFLSGP